MPIPFLPKEEKERAQEFLNRYNGGTMPISIVDLEQYVVSVWREGRHSERMACIKAAQAIRDNAVNSHPKEVSETGLEFQRGRRIGAEEIMSSITSRAALTFEQEAAEHGEARMSKLPRNG